LALATFSSELTFVTPAVLSESAIARPIWSADFALPFSVTSPLCASTSIEDAIEASWLSACSLPLIIVMRTESSVLPVGAPTTLSFVRTIVTPRSRSAWMSDGETRNCVICVEMSPLVAVAVSEVDRVESAATLPVELVLPVALVLPVVEDEDDGEVDEVEPLLVVSFAMVEPVPEVEPVALREPLVLALPLWLPDVEVEALGDCELLLVSVDDFVLSFCASVPLEDVLPVEALLRSLVADDVSELLGVALVEDVFRFVSLASEESEDVEDLVESVELKEPLPLAEPLPLIEPLPLSELPDVDAVGAPAALLCAVVLSVVDDEVDGEDEELNDVLLLFVLLMFVFCVELVEEGDVLLRPDEEFCVEPVLPEAPNEDEPELFWEFAAVVP
jgi:hypothetical protein